MGYRGRRLLSLLGAVVHARAYYHCGRCHAGHFPSDAALGVAGSAKLTPAARQVVALAGTLESFGTAARRLLPVAAGMNLSAATVRRVTEAVGQDVAERRAAGEVFGSGRPWDWHLDRTGRKVACVELDATGVPQQGPGGEQAEGRMANLAGVFNPPPAGDPQRAVWERRYVAGLLPLPEAGAQLRRECRAVGVASADVVVCLTDGGAGLEGCLTDALAGIAGHGPQPPVEFVLDFYHAAEHLREFAKAWLPHEEGRRRELVSAWCRTLKHSGGSALLAELETLDLSGAAAVTESHRLLRGHLRENGHRTDYPRYLANGWPIGSGLVEAACKTVVGERLKKSGMRWREAGTTELCQLRALLKSQPEVWDHHWCHLGL